MAAQYRADHVGSFLRPPELLEARKNAVKDPQRLRSLEDFHIRRVLAKQKELGFELVTDGELRRRNFMSDFTDAVEGFDLGDAVARNWKAGDSEAAPVSSVTGIVAKKLRLTRPRTGHEWIRKELRTEPDAALDEAIKADNACFKAARRPGVMLAIHLCRGNNRSHWYAEGGYDAIADKMFGTLDVDRFLLEYDDERSGTFAPLRFIPKGKTVVLGLVSSKLPQMEGAGELVRRIEEASKYVPMENLALSPQCGFASTAEGNLITEDRQWAKLKLVVDTARRVWGGATSAIA